MKTAEADLSAARTTALAEFEKTAAAYEKATSTSPGSAEVQVEHDRQGNPAFVMFTKGAVRVGRASPPRARLVK